MEPDTQDDNKAVNKSDLLTQEENSIKPGYRSGLFSNSTGSSRSGASTSTPLRDGGSSDSTGLDEPGFFNSDSTSDLPQKLNTAENSSFQSSAFSSIAGGAASLKGIKNILWGTSNRKRATVGGGTVAGLLAGGIVVFSVISGPFEFIHIAQLMDKFHFSSIHDAENSRLEKIAQFIRDPEKPERTRLGLVGNVIADQLEAKIQSETGLSPYYEEGVFKGWIADDKSFDGYSLDEVKQSMAQELNTDAGSLGTVKVNGKDVPIYNPDNGGFNIYSRYKSQVGTARDLFTKAGFNNISSVIASRVLKSRAGWTFHPIKALDSAYQQKLLAAGKAELDKLKQQFDQQEQATIDSDTTAPPTTNEDGSEQDSSGKPVQDETRSGAASAGESINADASESNISGKIAGGGAALIGVACIMNGINQSAPGLRLVKVMLPMMKFAGQIINLGSQIPSGQDIDTIQTGFFQQFLHGTNSSGQSTSWDQARSIQAELGQPLTGPDIPKSAQVFNGGVPFSFLQGVPGLGTTCSILGSPVGIIGSAIIAPLGTLFQQVIVGPVLKDAVSSLANWLTGAPINILKGAGADDGNYINYGTLLSANDQFASAGGVPLTPSQSSTITEATSSIDNSEFQSKSLAYRIFNPYDDQTVASKIIDNYGVQTASQDMASIFTNIGSVFSSTFNNLANLFTGAAKTNAQQSYDYNGLEAVGFSADDLANPKYNDPFQVACTVAGGPGCPSSDGNGILGDPNDPNSAFNQTYKNKIYACFGDTVTYNPSEGQGGAWDINFTNSGPLDMYGASSDNTPYQQANCGSTDANWTAIRFWILDTQSIEGYDCYTGGTNTADQSCQDVGVDNGDSSTASNTGSTTPPTTSTGGSTIDMTNLYSDSTSVACAPNTKDIGVYDGYTNGNLVKIRLCAISNLPSSGAEANGGYGVTGANGNCPLNSRVSGAVYAMVAAAKQAGVTLTTDSCFRTMAHQEALQGGSAVAAKPGYSNHQMGLAMDFSIPECETTISGQCSDPGNSMWDWLSQNASKFEYKSGVPSEAWHWSPTGN